MAKELIGLGTIGVGVFGNEYSRARALGHTDTEALTSATLNAASEVLLTKVFGGFFGTIGNTMGIKGVLQPIISKYAKNPAMRLLMYIGSQTIGENLEEYAQLLIEPLIRNVSFGEDNQIKLKPDGLMENIAIVTLTSVFLGGMSYIGIRNESDIRRTGLYMSDELVLTDKLQRKVLAFQSDVSPNRKAENYFTKKELALIDEIGSRLKAGEIELLEKAIIELEKTYGADMGGMTYQEMLLATSEMNNLERLGFGLAWLEDVKSRKDAEAYQRAIREKSNIDERSETEENVVAFRNPSENLTKEDSTELARGAVIEDNVAEEGVMDGVQNEVRQANGGNWDILSTTEEKQSKPSIDGREDLPSREEYLLFDTTDKYVYPNEKDQRARKWPEIGTKAKKNLLSADNENGIINTHKRIRNADGNEKFPYVTSANFDQFTTEKIVEHFKLEEQEESPIYIGRILTPDDEA